jgi:hypothetical protein
VPKPLPVLAPIEVKPDKRTKEDSDDEDLIKKAGIKKKPADRNYGIVKPSTKAAMKPTVDLTKNNAFDGSNEADNKGDKPRFTVPGLKQPDDPTQKDP